MTVVAAAVSKGKCGIMLPSRWQQGDLKWQGSSVKVTRLRIDAWPHLCSMRCVCVY